MLNRDDLRLTSKTPSSRASLEESPSALTLPVLQRVYQQQTDHTAFAGQFGGQNHSLRSSPPSFSVRASIGEETQREHDSQADYQDFSSKEVEPNTPMSPERRRVRGPVASFLKTLHTLLQHADEKKFSHIVSWAKHGRAFRVHDSDAFVNVVMPQYFRQSKFTSFQRQLSIYGFQRMTKRGPDQGSYWHAMFLRGMPHLTEKMKRTTVKCKGVRTPYSPEKEPDFHAMPYVGVETSLAKSRQAALLLPPSRKPVPAALNQGADSQTASRNDLSTYLASSLLRGPRAASTGSVPSDFSAQAEPVKGSSMSALSLNSSGLDVAIANSTLSLGDRPVEETQLPPHPPSRVKRHRRQQRRPLYSEKDADDLVAFLDDVDLSVSLDPNHPAKRDHDV